MKMTGQRATPTELDEARESMHRQMLSSVSHDLKTPLATIIGSLEVYQRLREKLTPEKVESLLSSALSEAYRLDSFITNILDMAKLEAGAVVPRAEWCDIQYLLKDCIARLGLKAVERKISVKSVTAIEKNFVDPMLLSRAIILVLDNAIKYGGTDEITIEYGRQDEQTSFIRVRDQGTGIPAGKEESIFSKYTRFNHTDYQSAGTGLGLAACRQLMQLLNGQVQARTHPDGGAEFTLSYPYISNTEL
jgi:two-component system sensor histidine kinase KdpD